MYIAGNDFRSDNPEKDEIKIHIVKMFKNDRNNAQMLVRTKFGL